MRQQVSETVNDAIFYFKATENLHMESSYKVVTVMTVKNLVLFG